MTQPKFGTAGAGDLFYTKGYKNSYEVPAFLAGQGLQAFEYQCGRGVRLGGEKARLLAEQARQHKITLSIHAPYYISLVTNDPEKQDKNLKYFRESAALAKELGANRIVFHPGGLSKKSRAEAYTLAAKSLKYILEQMDNEGYGGLTFCPETMGKINQLGDLAEIINLCKIKESLLPCVDFGHMNSRMQGGIDGLQAYEQIFAKIENELGRERTANLHCHFSKIQYNTGGEVRHLTFADTSYGPDYQPLMELLYHKKYTPTIICESDGTQAEDALEMAQSYWMFTNR